MFKKVLLVIPILAIFVAIGLFWFMQNTNAPGIKTDTQDFLIVKGSSASKVGNDLEKAGLIKSSLAFKIYIQVTAKQKKIQAGEFRLSPSYNLFKTIDTLSAGPVEIWVTIPEGFRREQIAQKFVEVLNKDEEFTNQFLDLTKDQEGYLFPDTYLFPKDVTSGAVARVLNQTFNTKMTEKMKTDSSNLGYSLNQVVTMASIVERETLTAEERPIVAGILYKRLEAGWPLQADATLQFVTGSSRCGSTLDCDWWEVPTVADRELNSRYNTYRFIGLPPAPIANPGITSLSAASYPEDSEYWYYIHDDDGKIHYAKTLEEHNANINKYLR